MVFLQTTLIYYLWGDLMGELIEMVEEIFKDDLECNLVELRKLKLVLVQLAREIELLWERVNELR